MHGSPIPNNQCAIIVGSSTDKQAAERILSKFKDAFASPLIIKVIMDFMQLQLDCMRKITLETCLMP